MRGLGSNSPLVPGKEGGERIERRKRFLVRCGSIAGLIFLLGSANLSLPLQEPDEGRYAAIAATMQGSGDWLVPRLNGIPYWEKPPLYFWLAAGSIAIFGRSEAAVRLPSLLASGLSVLLVVHWAKRLKMSSSPLIPGLILLSFPLFLLLGRTALVDPTLAFLTGIALYAGYRSFVESSQSGRQWGALFWGAAALACLTKGPIGAVLPVAPTLVYLAVHRDGRGFRRLLDPIGLGVFAVLALPWYLFMESEQPGYLSEFILSQNLDRFATGGEFRKDKPIWFYVPLLLAATFPWSAALLARIGRRAPSPATTDAHQLARRYLLCAVLVPLFILSLAHSKLPTYLLPLMTPLSLWAALELNGRSGDEPAAARLRRRSAAGLVVGGGAIAATGVAMAIAGQDLLASGQPAVGQEDGRWGAIQELLPAGSTLLVISGVLIGVGGAAMWRNRRVMAAVACAAAFAGGYSLLSWISEKDVGAYSSKPVAELIEARARLGEPVILYQKHLRGLGFYSRRHVVLWNASHSEFGHRVQPGATLEHSLQGSPHELERLLSDHGTVLILLEPGVTPSALAAVLPSTLTVLGRANRWTLVRAQTRLSRSRSEVRPSHDHPIAQRSISRAAQGRNSIFGTRTADRARSDQGTGLLRSRRNDRGAPRSSGTAAACTAPEFEA